MATLATNVVTLVDHAKRMSPDGKIAAIAEMLTLNNPILADAVYKEGNLPTGERATIRTGLPTVQWRQLNKGVTPSKSLTDQVDESCGMLEAWSEVDKDLADLNGNTGAFRLSEAQAFLEAMNQEMADTMFYGNQGTDPAEFTGLLPRFDSKGAANGENIITCDGTSGASTSVWLVTWGLNTLHCIYPKGSTAGLFHEDLGLQTIETVAGIGATNGRLRAYQDHWQWKTGLVVKDWRYVVRIAEIDAASGNLDADAVNIAQQMIRSVHRIPNMGMGRSCFYMNRTVAEALDLQARTVVSGDPLVAVGTAMGTQVGAQSYDNWMGKPVQSFRGIPIRVCDSLKNTENDVAA